MDDLPMMLMTAMMTLAAPLVRGEPPYVDTRNIRNGVPMLIAGYTDQPYCAVVPGAGRDGGATASERWVCVITASMGGEGSAGEQVYSVRSDDRGRSWSSPLSVEPGTAVPGGLPNAYANIVWAPALRRLYTVYNLNRDNVTMSGRGDELGYFYMRYSADEGASWSSERFLVPYPSTWVDRHNDFLGAVHIMWTVDQIKVLGDGGTVAFAFTKIGRYVQNPPEEVFFMSSTNLLTEPDAAAVTWTLLPTGDHGLRPPSMYDANTTVMEEGHLLPLAAGCAAMARTDKGFLAFARTADRSAASGWAATELARYWAPAPATAPLLALPDLPLTDVAPSGCGVPPGRASTCRCAAASGCSATYRTALKNERGPFTPRRHPSGAWLLLFSSAAPRGTARRACRTTRAAARTSCTAGASPRRGGSPGTPSSSWRPCGAPGR